MAIDIRISGVNTAELRDITLSLHLGGIGYYPRSDFVRVDMGRVLVVGQSSGQPTDRLPLYPLTVVRATVLLVSRRECLGNKKGNGRYWYRHC